MGYRVSIYLSDQQGSPDMLAKDQNGTDLVWENNNVVCDFNCEFTSIAAGDPLSETYALLKQQCGEQDHTYNRIDQWVLVAKHIDIYRSDSSNPSHTLGTEYSVYDLTKFENGKLFACEWNYRAAMTKSRGGCSGNKDVIVRFVAGESPPTLEFGNQWPQPLLNLLFTKHQFVKRCLDENKLPTGGQLAQFLRSFVVEAKPHMWGVAGVSLEKGLEKLGWSLATNSPVAGSAPPQPEDVLAFLGNTSPLERIACSELRKHEHGGAVWKAAPAPSSARPPSLS